MILLVLAPASSALTNQALTLTVYSDGYVSVSQIVSVGRNTASFQVPLVSSTVSDLVATDQNGSPLSYSFSSGGRNITIYTLGATEVILRYDTDNLTTKAGTVWSLAFTPQYNSTVILPQLSTLISVSGTPYTINQTDAYTELTLSPGPWTIKYGVPFTSGSITTVPPTGSTTQGSQGAPSSTLTEAVAGIIAAVLAAGAIYFRWWMRRRLGPVSGDLRPDDLQVLDFIREKGGKVLEPEIRIKFALPKTSAWRQIKRLERLGYVKVTKIGSQNQIELMKERNAGA